MSFDTDHPAFVENVPEGLRAEMDALLERMRTGELDLEMPVAGAE